MDDGRLSYDCERCGLRALIALEGEITPLGGRVRIVRQLRAPRRLTLPAAIARKT